ELQKLCLEVLIAHPKDVEAYTSGNERALNALIGPTMKASKGKANPKMLIDIFKSLIK
ncbi:MAG: Asp-tRNA(Asn)/Glu-tRNA(Gln) amidotransferase GatCAB subunit B, partial [Opitutales bacterium]|nr:Asp-tRNA(Asn)/Glu-tRNA(Gln) amidotransferase GatCAB subunit B [Opitutales bacterium]